MPNLQNAKKALRVSARKRVMNDKRRRAMKERVKDVLIDPKNLPQAYQAIDKAVKRGILNKNAAARKKSRLVKTVKKMAK